MRWLIGLLFLIAACVNGSPLPNVEPASSVHFDSAIAECTAISIGGGSVLTAGHCITSFPATIEGFPATVKWVNRMKDVALLHVPELTQAPFSELACRDPQIGEVAMMIGDTAWRENIYVFGKVASVVYMRSNHRQQSLVLFDMRASSGNSGAPIYDTTGRVFAMVVATVSNYGNMLAAIPGSTLCALIESEEKITPSASHS